MKNRTRTILIVVAVLITLFFIFRMREMYQGEAGSPEDEEVEENPEIKKEIKEKGISQEDVDALMSII
jgi:Na+/H+ antiporter NhaC